jgi:hypothetical protein
MENPSLKSEMAMRDVADGCNVSVEDRAALLSLEERINALLPPQYQSCYDAVSPTSMGSAGLKFGADGRVAWDEMWTSFCDLALAGGPAHRGTLLEAVSPEEARAEPEKYQAVVEEIGRGIWLATELPVLPRLAPGWVGVRCDSVPMAVWMVRAIVVENVMARRVGEMLYLPAGPHFRLAKEIKNVVTAVAKTHHYWAFHLPSARAATAEAPLEPALPDEVRARPHDYDAVVKATASGVRRATGLLAAPGPALGWVGVPCPEEDMAVWLMRAILVENVVVRREGAILYLPAAPGYLPDGEIRQLVSIVARAWRLWHAHRSATSRPSGPASPSAGTSP